MMFSCESQATAQNTTILRLHGNLDAMNAPQLRREADHLVAANQYRLILDLSEVELIDSSGVGALVSVFKRIRSLDGDLKIAGLTGQPREIFRLLRLDRAFEIFASTADALEDNR